MKKHDLLVEEVPPQDIEQHPDNANNGDIDAIEDSILVNGFYSPIIVQRSTGYILAGNHRYMVAIKLGYRTVPVVYLDVDDLEAARIMVADNRTARLGADDESGLLDLLQMLQGTDAGLAGTGYTFEKLTYLIELSNEPLKFEPPAALPKPPVDIPEPEEDTEDPIPDRGRAIDPDLQRQKPSAGYSVNPLASDDGNCYEILVMHPAMRAFSPNDFNRVLKQLGETPLDGAELRSFDIPAWQKDQP